MTGDTLMPFAEGDVVLIPPSMPHYWEYKPESANNAGEITYLMVAFSPELIRYSIKKRGSLLQNTESRQKR